MFAQWIFPLFSENVLVFGSDKITKISLSFTLNQFSFVLDKKKQQLKAIIVGFLMDSLVNCALNIRLSNVWPFIVWKVSFLWFVAVRNNLVEHTFYRHPVIIPMPLAIYSLILLYRHILMRLRVSLSLVCGRLQIHLPSLIISHTQLNTHTYDIPVVTCSNKLALWMPHYKRIEYHSFKLIQLGRFAAQLSPITSSSIDFQRRLIKFVFAERRTYMFECIWKEVIDWKLTCSLSSPCIKSTLCRNQLAHAI